MKIVASDTRSRTTGRIFILLIGHPESINFLNIPLTLEGMPDEPFAACVLSMNLFTQVRELPALQSHLWATCYKRFGINGAEIILLGVPQQKILPVIREVMSQAKDIPHSDKGGAWAMMQKEGYGSYLMNFGTLTETSVDDWIKMCKSLGFNQIDNHGGGADFFRFGDFVLNPDKWPGGWDSFKRINTRLHDAGISTTTGFFIRNSLSLRIGDEVIEFKGVTQTPPYKFTGLKRGACHTKIASYTAGESVFHLREMFGRFVPGPETRLFTEIAGRTADIVSDYGFDGIYFDAIDGSDILGEREDAWHYRSRWQAWDRPVRGYKRFVDIHSAAIKSARLFVQPNIKPNEYEHGLWRGHTPQINKYTPAENGGLLLPLHMGWWGNQTWNPPQVEPTFPDDIEYLCCKMIGNNAGLSMLGGVDEKTLELNPLFRRLIAIIKQYEDLRHRNYFSDSVRAMLREPGKEFTLVQDRNGDWRFKPITYQKHKVAGNSHPSSSWTVNNEFGTQPVKLRIEPLMSVKAFNDPANIELADFSGSGEFANKGSADGVTGDIKIATEKPSEGLGSGLFTASVSSASAGSNHNNRSMHHDRRRKNNFSGKNGVWHVSRIPRAS